MINNSLIENISVPLQEPFSYSLIPVIISAIISVLGIIAIVVLYIKKHPKKAKIAIRETTVNERNRIKMKYIQRLNQLLQMVCSGQMAPKIAYQSLSMCIREFVYEMTGIEAQKYTLQDIKQLRLPILEMLISEYYVPEFSMSAEGDIQQSIEKTRRIIEQWM